MTYPNEGLVSNRGNGYRDLLGHIDLATYRRIPWEDNVPFFLLRFADQDTKDWVPVDPRSLLEKVAAQAKEQGWDCMGGAEFEVGPPALRALLTHQYFQYAETAESVQEKGFINLTPLTPGSECECASKADSRPRILASPYDQQQGLLLRPVHRVCQVWR